METIINLIGKLESESKYQQMMFMNETFGHPTLGRNDTYYKKKVEESQQIIKEVRQTLINKIKEL